MKVCIVGAGPAGLFAAYELLGKIPVCIVERGDEPLKRKRGQTSGVGGAGLLSDGKLNLTYMIGGDPRSFGRTPDEVQKIIEKTDETFLKFGADKKTYGVNRDSLNFLKRKASSNGIEFIAGRQRHMGTDKTKLIVDKFYRYLKERGVKFILNTEIREIEKKKNFILKTDGKEFRTKYLVAAPGRAGAYWFRSQAYKLGIETKYGPIDVGVRVEFPSTLYEPIEEIMYDAKFRFYTKTYDDMVRTFCTNPCGFVTVEGHKEYVLVNGDARKNERTENTNLALLSRIELTDPVEDTTEYGRSIARLANVIGGGKPIIQRYKDLVRGKRSTWKRISRALITPTLREVTPGDIAMALPNRIVKNIIEAMERLDSVIEGIASDSTLLYAPEIKFYDTTYVVSKNMETKLENLYVAGDASGHSRGIVYSAVTGMLAARGILKREGV
ncbi:MAG: NAD(P)/FAD-dependent oxidoreductase [Candidatus Methanofastidiosia archaeon]